MTNQTQMTRPPTKQQTSSAKPLPELDAALADELEADARAAEIEASVASKAPSEPPPATIDGSSLVQQLLAQNKELLARLGAVEEADRARREYPYTAPPDNQPSDELKFHMTQLCNGVWPKDYKSPGAEKPPHGDVPPQLAKQEYARRVRIELAKQADGVPFLKLWWPS